MPGDDACDAAASPVWGHGAAALASQHLDEVSRDGTAWTRVLRCPMTGTDWLEDYPFSEMHGGGPTRLRRLPLGPACECGSRESVEADDARAYMREHLVWVRHLGEGLNLWVCPDGVALWEDSGSDQRVHLTRLWLATDEPIRPMLAYSSARGW